MKNKKQTVSVPEAGKVLGVGRNASYEAARKGGIPTLRIGKRLVVPIPALERLLALGADQFAANDAGAEKGTRLADEIPLAEEEERRCGREHKPNPRKRPANADNQT